MRFWHNWTIWRPPTPSSIATSTTADATHVRVADSLRLRLWLIVVIALLPVAALSIWQGVERLRLDVADAQDELRRSALVAASDEKNIFASAEQILRALANQEDVRDGGATCGRALGNAVKGLAYFPNMARIGVQGHVLCAALPLVGSGDATKQPWWPEVVSKREFMISAPTFSPSANRNVLLGVLPLLTPNGAFDGTLNIAIDLNWLDALLRNKSVPRGALVGLFDRSGKLIAASNPQVAAFVFAKGAKAGTGQDGLLEGTGPDNEPWSVAMAPLIRRDTYVGFAMPQADLFALTYAYVATDLLLPFLMIALASAAVWYAADRLVVRWIVLLQRIAGAYAGGHYAVRPAALKDAPREFRELGETLANMAEAIQERDTRLRDGVAQKSMLIKEIHHRVKNNLQIVMSLLSLQANKMRESPARDALEQSQTRINALALVHRILYELDNAGLVDMNALWAELVEQLHQSFRGERRDIQIKVDAGERCVVNADTAVPLTLFAVEALTNAYKHAFDANAGVRSLELRLTAGDPGRLKLMVIDTGVGIDFQTAPGELSTGSRLMAAFAQQVSGTISTRAREGGGTIVELDFPDPNAPPKPVETAMAAA